MADAPNTPPTSSSFLERLISSRNRDISLFLPIILGFTNTVDSTDPDQESAADRIILINPVTQEMVVMEGRSSSGFDSLLRDLLTTSKDDGQPPASKASIAAMPTVEEIDGGECAICLEGLGKGKEMPCKHRFHGDCIEKWLGIHGSCPVCRYKMPVDDDDDEKTHKSNGEEEGEGGRRGRREIWVSFSLS